MTSELAVAAVAAAVYFAPGIAAPTAPAAPAASAAGVSLVASRSENLHLISLCNTNPEQGVFYHLCFILVQPFRYECLRHTNTYV